MKLVGLLMALAGWVVPVVALTQTQSLAARGAAAVLGILVSLVGILVVVNGEHLKHAIWKR
ncbi:MAG TPA: hypothetical protein VK210_07620 [Terriglobia bacterium]|nr:hypothetical protein [Terriglobia bacterium]